MPAAFASLLFDSPEQPLIGQTQSFATFPPFRARARSFFRIFRFSHLVSASLLFSDTLHLRFVISPHSQKFDIYNSFDGTCAA